MKTCVNCLVGALCLVASAAHAACELPAVVASIPDGRTATEAELLAVQEEVKAYVTAMDAYIACENEAITAEGGAATDDFLHWMTTRIESARSEVDAVARRFNAEVVAFRESRQAAGPPR